MERSFGVSLEIRCLRCRVTRDVEGADLVLQESSSDRRAVKVSCVYMTPKACERGERRVRVKAGLDFG